MSVTAGGVKHRVSASLEEGNEWTLIGRRACQTFPPSLGAFQKGLERRELSKARAGGAEARGEESSYVAYDVNDS